MSEKRYIIVPYVFDTSMWALLLDRMAKDFSYEEMEELIGVTKPCIVAWQRQKFKGEFQYPSMTSMMTVCNLMDVTPALMFKVSEE